MTRQKKRVVVISRDPAIACQLLLTPTDAIATFVYVLSEIVFGPLGRFLRGGWGWWRGGAGDGDGPLRPDGEPLGESRNRGR